MQSSDLYLRMKTYKKKKKYKFFLSTSKSTEIVMQRGVFNNLYKNEIEFRIFKCIIFKICQDYDNN